MLLQAWPEADDVTSGSPFNDEEIPELFRSSKGSESFNSVVTSVAEIKKKLASLKKTFDESKARHGWRVRTEVAQLESSSAELKCIAETLRAIAMKADVDNVSDNWLKSSCVALASRVDTLVTSLLLDLDSSKASHMPTCDTSDVDEKTRRLVTSSMLVVQDLLKYQQQHADDPKAFYDPVENLLTKRLLGRMTSLSPLCRVPELLRHTDELVTSLRELSENAKGLGCVEVPVFVREQLPLLCQCVNLVQFVLTNHVAAFRSCAKFLSVLQSIFTDLALKVRIRLSK